MASVIFHFATIEVDLNTGPDIQDITDDLDRIIGRSGIENGQATACIVGSTGSLTTIEFEPGVVQDLKEAINRLAPKDLAYAHELAWHDANDRSSYEIKKNITTHNYFHSLFFHLYSFCCPPEFCSRNRRYQSL